MRISRICRIAGGLQLSASLLAMAAAAHAQSAPQNTAPPVNATGVDDIIVTAQRREENLQKVPLAITALSAAALENRGINSLQSLQTTGLPGVQIQPFGGQQNTIEVMIRGATTSSSSDVGRESSTAIYLDDVYLPRAQGSALTLADPQRIEVLRGPQGQLFGRGATGGALRIVTADPTGKLGGRFLASYGNYDAQRYEAHINLPEFANFSVKVDGVIDKHDGYTKNLSSPNIARSNDFGLKDDKGFRVGVKWQPSTSFKAIYAFTYLDSFTTPEWEQAVPRPSFVPSLPLPTAAAQAYYGETSAPIWRGPTPIQSTRPDRAWAPFYVFGFYTKSWQQSLRMEYQASDHLTIRSITGLGVLKQTSLTQNADTISAPIALGASGIDAANFVPFLEPITGAPTGARTYAVGGAGMQKINIRSKFFSQELQLVGDYDEHQFVAGLYYSDEDLSEQNAGSFDTIFYDPNNTGSAVVRNYSTFVTVNPFYLSSAAKIGVDSRANSKSFAAFAQETFTPHELDDRLHLTFGIRYTDDQKSGVRVADGVSVPGAILTNLAFPVLANRRFDPATTIAYDLSAQNNIYVRVSRAYKSGGYNLTGNALIVNGVPQIINFGAEQNTAIEFGSKNEFFDRRLRLNVVGFYSWIRDQQLNVFAVPPGGVSPISQTINAPGNTRTYGLEVESQIIPTRGLTLSINYAYLNQKLPTIPASIDPAVALPISPTSYPAIYYASNSPPHTVSGSFDYESNIADFGTGYIHLDGAYSSLFHTTNRQSQNNYLVPRRLESLNGRIGVRDIGLAGAKLNLSFYMNNITNVTAVQASSGFGDAFFMPPRTFGVQGIVSF